MNRHWLLHIYEANTDLYTLCPRDDLARDDRLYIIELGIIELQDLANYYYANVADQSKFEYVYELSNMVPDNKLSHLVLIDDERFDDLINTLEYMQQESEFATPTTEFMLAEFKRKRTTARTCSIYVPLTYGYRVLNSTTQLEIPRTIEYHYRCAFNCLIAPSIMEYHLRCATLKLG
jgi:hypothetical protein